MKQEIYEKAAIEVIDNTSDAVILYSPTTLEKMLKANLISGSYISSHPHIEISANSGVSYDTLEVLAKGAKVYIGLGGGTAIDVAKYLAYKSKAHCIAIPSMLSTNVFATNKVAVIRDGVKRTEDAKLPDEVIFDRKLLELSPKQNLYGLVDVLSICTALEDWLIAFNDQEELIDYNIFGKASVILSRARNLIDGHLPDCIDPLSIFSVVLSAGYITNEYGNGRPESGSEHIIAKEIEALVKVPHALAVTCGIAVVSQLQNNFKRAVFELDRLHMGTEVRNSQITPEILKQAILNAKPRDDRYTVINRFDLSYIADELVEGTKIW